MNIRITIDFFFICSLPIKLEKIIVQIIIQYQHV